MCFSSAWSSLLVTLSIFLISSLSLSFLTCLFFFYLKSGLPFWVSLTCRYFNDITHFIFTYVSDFSMLLVFCSWSWVEFIYFDFLVFCVCVYFFFSGHENLKSSVALSISACVSFIVDELSRGLRSPWLFMPHAFVLRFAHCGSGCVLFMEAVSLLLRSWFFFFKLSLFHIL